MYGVSVRFLRVWDWLRERMRYCGTDTGRCVLELFFGAVDMRVWDTWVSGTQHVGSGLRAKRVGFGVHECKEGWYTMPEGVTGSTGLRKRISGVRNIRCPQHSYAGVVLSVTPQVRKEIIAQHFQTKAELLPEVGGGTSAECRVLAYGAMWVARLRQLCSSPPFASVRKSVGD